MWDFGERGPAAAGKPRVVRGPGRGQPGERGRCGLKTIGSYALLVGLFATTITVFNQVSGRLDIMQAESNRRFEAMRAEMNALRTEMNRRFDTLEAENQRQHDAMEEVLRVFEGRITRLEENAGVDAGGAE